MREGPPLPKYGPDLDEPTRALFSAKTVNLLGQVLAKQAAHEAGADEALMIDRDGYVTECGSTSFFIVRDGRILTRELNNDILPGVTRRAIVELCEQAPIALEQTRFTLDDALQALLVDHIDRLDPIGTRTALR